MGAGSDPPEWPRELDRTTVEVPILATPLPVAPTHHEQLLVLVGDEPGRAVAVGDGVSIGRGGECDLVLAESSVSRRHARVLRRGGGIWVEDLGSRNGTFVNGVAVKSHELAIGDRVQLGPKVVLLLTHEDPLKVILRERQKMEAIGRMAAGVAHDFNNVTSAALATCDHLESELEAMGVLDARSVAECMRDLRMALERGADLTRSLASLGRRKPTTAAEPVDLASVCEEVARLCERTFGPRYEIRRRWRRKLFVRAHRTELHQILVNLCLNARDAMPNGGTLRIAAERGSGTRFGGGDGEWILLRVADTGTGMSDEVRERIFEPFYTTKREGRGSGLGLATVHELVRGMSGRIEVESAPGRGSVFLVWLPADASTRSSGEMVVARSAEKPRAPAAPAVPVLVVEDQEIVRRSVVRILRAAGHDVAAVGDGLEAIDIVTGANPRPAVVLLDLDLPELSGDETLLRLLAIDASLKVIAVSGHWDPDRREALLRAGAVGFLGKPFDAQSLRSTVAEALADASR